MDRLVVPDRAGTGASPVHGNACGVWLTLSVQCPTPNTSVPIRGLDLGQGDVVIACGQLKMNSTSSSPGSWRAPICVHPATLTPTFRPLGTVLGRGGAGPSTGTGTWAPRLASIAGCVRSSSRPRTHSSPRFGPLPRERPPVDQYTASTAASHFSGQGSALLYQPSAS